VKSSPCVSSPRGLFFPFMLRQPIPTIQPVYTVDEVANFVWQCATGEQRKPEEMANTHLLLAVKQIWNSRCAPWQTFSDVHPMRLKHWSDRYTKAAIYALCLELRKRWHYLSDAQRTDLTAMTKWAKETWSDYAKLLA
jgi:hypothetical protein